MLGATFGPGVALAEELPTLKAGLWESTVITSSSVAPLGTYRQCMDGTIHLEDLVRATGGMCDLKWKRAGDRIETETSCKLGIVSARGKGSITGDFNSKLRIETTSSVSMDEPSPGAPQIILPDADETNAFKPNENGAIVGAFGESGSELLFVLKQGQFTKIALPNGKPVSQDDGGMNSRGEIVGTYCDVALPCLIGPADNHGFLLSGDQLSTIDVAGGAATALTAINARGDIVGAYTDAHGQTHALLLERHGR